MNDLIHSYLLFRARRINSIEYNILYVCAFFDAGNSVGIDVRARRTEFLSRERLYNAKQPHRDHRRMFAFAFLFLCRRFRPPTYGHLALVTRNHSLVTRF